MTSFFESIQFQARSRPKSPAIMTARNIISYEELVGRVRAANQYLTDNGLKEGDIIAVNVHEPISNCCTMIAAMAAGIATNSVAGNRPVLPGNISFRAMVADHKVEETDETKVLTVAPNWLKDIKVKEGASLVQIKKQDFLARIICTSGTTGAQKAVPFTEEQLMSRAWGHIIGLRAPLGPSKTLAMMGLASGAGFTNMMLVLMTGGTLMLVPGMAQLGRFSALYRMDRIIASTAQLIGMLRAQDNDNADFSGVASMVVGGSHIPRAVAKRARAICRNIICLYGSTEVGVVATAPAGITIKEQSAVGYVVPGAQLEIVDESGKELGFGKEGIIRVKAPGAPNRYLNDDKASAEVFRDGWFYPGDIGSLSSDRLLCVSGRVSERINAGGVKVAPSVIEDVISMRPEVSDVGAFEYTNPEGISEIAVAIVPHESIHRENFNRAELREYFRKRLREKTPRRWMIVREIPRNEQGKIDRAQLKDMAQRRLANTA
jgi:acyl-CoA synthetase (AMP-forming)/AMP-acid ligase II